MWDLWDEGNDKHDYCQSIYELVKHFKCKEGLEIGVRFGKSALAFLKNGGDLVGVDPNPEFDIESFMEKQGYGNKFTFIKGYSPDALEWMPKEHFDYIYIDGEHTARAVMYDFLASWPLLKKGGIMVFDDYKEDQGYDTTVSTAVDKILESLDKKYLTMTDFGLHPNPHGAAIIIKD